MLGSFKFWVSLLITKECACVLKLRFLDSVLFQHDRQIRYSSHVWNDWKVFCLTNCCCAPGPIWLLLECVKVIASVNTTNANSFVPYDSIPPYSDCQLLLWQSGISLQCVGSWGRCEWQPRPQSSLPTKDSSEMKRFSDSRTTEELGHF